jgi:hypothetical protein
MQNGATEDAGQAYLRRTRDRRDRLVGGRMDWSDQPDWFKTYPGAARMRQPAGSRCSSQAARSSKTRSRPVSLKHSW